MATNITEFSNRCAPDLPGCPIALINQKVVDALVQFAKDTHRFEYEFEYEVEDTDVDSTDNYSATLDLSTITGDPFANKRPIAVNEFRIDTAKFKVEYRDLATNLTNLDIYRYGSVRYFSFPSDTEIKICPLEEEDQTLFLKVAFQPLLTITSIDDFIFSDYHEAIEAYAKYVLMDQKNKPWSNHQQAIQEWDKYAEKMGMAKVDIIQKRSKRSLMIQPTYIF